MNKQQILEKFRLKNGFLLFFIIFTSCTFLIVLNLYTVKILSSSQAYSSGESNYSKGQKDAAAHLINYIFTSDKQQWEFFKKELSIPQASATFRLELSNNKNIDIAKKALLAGRNNEADFDNMIWLFENTKSFPFLREALTEWEIGDKLVNKMAILGSEIHQKISARALTDKEQKQYLQEITTLSKKLTLNEYSFAYRFGDNTRTVKGYLVAANIFFILIIISSVGFYYHSMVKKLLISKFEVEEKNRDLMRTNNELDKFVYSASHDLRSPITSLKGLVEIIKLEEEPEKIIEYLNLMDKSLDRQDQFISDIIDYSRNKRIESTIESINLLEIVDNTLDQFQYIKDANTIKIYKELEVIEINNNSLRLKIILNNLLSNAIKYADPNKTDKFIKIKTYPINNSFAIEVEDNGIGIKEDDLDRIFKMFYRADVVNSGSGIGLYIVNEAVKKLEGNITVTSQVGEGSIFEITIPSI